MNGAAPKLPATGSQVLVRQNLKPNARIDVSDSCHSTPAMPATINTRISANAPVARRKDRSLAPIRTAS